MTLSDRTWLYNRYLAWALMLASGLATPFAFAPYRYYALMPVLLGVLFLMAFVQPARATFLAYLWALGAYTAQNYWINIALHDVAGLPQMFAAPLTLLLPAFIALFPALTFWFLDKIRLPEAWRLLGALPALWAATEWLREHSLTGFGWGALGYSQIAGSALAGFAPVGGISLVTYCVALFTACVVGIVRLPGAAQKIFCLMLGAAIVLSGSLLKAHPFTTPDGTRATVGLAQGNIPQMLKWDPEEFAHTLQIYYTQVAQSHDQILLLPETAIPVLRQELPDGVLSQFASTAQRNGAALATGIAQASDDGRRYYNAIIDLSHYTPENPVLPAYAKNHLVPFGEYAPLPSLTSWLYGMMNMPMSVFSGGGRHQSPLAMANQRIAFNICYEDGFGDELVSSAKQSSLLANVSNMAWYGDSAAMDLQLQQSQARALEMGRYMVRATNTGQTAIISPRGDILALAQRNTRQVLHGDIEGRQGQTPYMRMGGSQPLLWLYAGLPMLLWILSLWTPGLFDRRFRQP